MREESHQAAFVDQAGDSTFDAGPIDFQQEREKVLDGQEEPGE
jgi:hypothetical protein